jgi:LPXTG-site transpeptidase (sortase) family protein
MLYKSTLCCEFAGSVFSYQNTKPKFIVDGRVWICDIYPLFLVLTIIMTNQNIAGKAGRGLSVFLASVVASLLFGAFTTLAADSPDLHVRAFLVPNKGVPAAVGGEVTYFYQIWNTSNHPVSAINITDDKCDVVTYDAVGQDLDVDHMLDKGELWSYFCTIIATDTTTNTVSVTGQSNGLPVSAGTTATLVLPAGSAENGSGANGTGSANGNNGAGGSTGAGNGTGAGANGGNGEGGSTGNTGIGGAAGQNGGTGGLDFNAVPGGMPNTGRGVSTGQENKFGENSGLLNIPSIGTKVKIETVGLSAKGNMDVPANARNVGLYKFGVKPGENGNAVLAGHLDTVQTSSGVFKKLDKLKAGDDVYVANGQEGTLHFKVNHTEVYDVNDAPIASIFGASDSAHLNLITCTGDWDNKLRQYSKRLVVYTDLVQ